jgi:hypothetical protein
MSFGVRIGENYGILSIILIAFKFCLRILLGFEPYNLLIVIQLKDAGSCSKICLGVCKDVSI